MSQHHQDAPPDAQSKYTIKDDSLQRHILSPPTILSSSYIGTVYSASCCKNYKFQTSLDVVRGGAGRLLRHNFNLKWAAPAGQFHAQASEFRPRAASSVLLLRPVTPSQHCGAFGRRVAGPPILSQSTPDGRQGQSQRLPSIQKLQYWRRDIAYHRPNGFCNNAQATQAYAPRWEA